MLTVKNIWTPLRSFEGLGDAIDPRFDIYEGK